MKSLRVNVGDGYDIFIERGILSDCSKYIKNITNASKVCLISDSNVYPIYGEIIKSQLKSAGFEVFDYVFEAGEASKTTASVVSMVEFIELIVEPCVETVELSVLILES